MPVLEDLRRAVGHHAQLGVLDGDEVLVVERLSTEHAVVNYTRIAAPDRFDLTRDPSGHVGFGMGLHQCVGQHVARLEAAALLPALAARVERIEPTAEPTRHLNNTMRAFASQPLRLHRAVSPLAVD
jgi:cytochrome P450